MNTVTVTLNSKVIKGIIVVCVIVALLSLIMFVNTNTGVKGIAHDYVKQYEHDSPNLEFRVKSIKYSSDDMAYITIEYYNGRNWDDYDSILVKKQLGKWQVQ